MLSVLGLSLVLSPLAQADGGPRPSRAKPSAAPAAAKQAPSAEPAAKPAAKVLPAKANNSKARKAGRPSARAADARPSQSKEGSAAMAALLRNYLDGKTRAFDRRLSAKLDKRGLSSTAAQRILARIDGAGGPETRRAFGTTTTRSLPSKGGLGATMQAGPARASVMPMMPAIILPPESVPEPTTFALSRAGLVTLATEDGDGTDELTMLAFVVRPKGDDYTLSTVELGSGQAASLGTQALTQSLWSGGKTDALVLTVLIEDDGGNAADAREEIEVLVGLAASVAATMPGDARLQVLATMVDYTMGLDGVGADPGRAARSVVATPIAADEWFPLWSMDHEKSAGIEWKLAIPHAMGTGRYELLLDVPGDPPAMPTVRMQITDAAFVGLERDGYGLNRVSVTLAIGNEAELFTLPDTKSARNLQPVARKVVAGDVEVRLSAEASYHKEVPQFVKDLCARAKTANQKARCANELKKYGGSTTRTIDLMGGPAETFRATYSTAFGGFHNAVSNKKGGPSPGSSAPTTPNKPLTKVTAKGPDSPSGTMTVAGSHAGG